MESDVFLWLLETTIRPASIPKSGCSVHRAAHSWALNSSIFDVEMPSCSCSMMWMANFGMSMDKEGDINESDRNRSEMVSNRTGSRVPFRLITSIYMIVKEIILNWFRKDSEKIETIFPKMEMYSPNQLSFRNSKQWPRGPLLQRRRRRPCAHPSNPLGRWRRTGWR